MYLIISDADGSATLSRASKVFHNGVDVIGLRAAEEEKVHQRRSIEEGPMKKRRSIKEGLTEKRRSDEGQRRFARRRSLGRSDEGPFVYIIFLPFTLYFVSFSFHSFVYI